MPELTRILDTLKNSDGSLASGRITITPSRAFAATDGTSVAAGSIIFAVVNGVVDLLLAPTEDADLSHGPAVAYRLEYFLKNRGHYSETWTVPRAAGGPFKISQLRGFWASRGFAMDFGHKLRGGFGTGLLFLAILLGLQISSFLVQLSQTISAWNHAAMRMDRTAQETMLTAQAVLVSVRGTTEQLRRSAEHQLGYYEAVGRRTSNLIAEMTFLIRSTNDRLGEVTQAATLFMQREAEVTAAAAEDFGRVAAQAEATLAESGRLLAELREKAAAPEVQRSLEAIKASARNLEAATAEATEASHNTAEATGYIRDMLSPKKKSFWRKLFELLIPRPAIAVR